jgi:hypothetical protein
MRTREAQSTLFRQKPLRRLAFLLAGLAVLVSGCGGAPVPTGGRDASDRDAEIYAKVLRKLVTVDHTFESESSPFDRIFIIDTVEGINGPSGGSGARTPLTQEVQEELTRRLVDLPPVEFVGGLGDVLVDDEQSCARVKGNGVLITLGPIAGDGDRVEIPNELFVACLAAQWLTYVVEHADGQWQVTGTTGPRAIA